MHASFSRRLARSPLHLSARRLRTLALAGAILGGARSEARRMRQLFRGGCGAQAAAGRGDTAGPRAQVCQQRDVARALEGDVGRMPDLQRGRLRCAEDTSRVPACVRGRYGDAPWLVWEEDVFLYNNVRTIEVYLIKRIKLYFIHIHCHKDCLASLGRCTLVPSASLTKTPSRSDHSVLPGRAAGAAAGAPFYFFGEAGSRAAPRCKV